MLVEARGLCHIHREGEVGTVALRGTDLALAASSWTSIMGPSGNRKSTLLRVLSDLLRPTAGSVLIDGVDLTRMNEGERARSRRRRVGLALQRDNLHPHLTVAGNVALPLRLDGRRRSRIRERVGQPLAEVGRCHRRPPPTATPGPLSGP
jgi:putative ABC transport system ATP-binding protein